MKENLEAVMLDLVSIQHGHLHCHHCEVTDLLETPIHVLSVFLALSLEIILVSKATPPLSDSLGS